MSVSINGTSGLVFNDASTQNTAATGFGFKNRLINSAMMIDQRNAGASVTINSDADKYTLDRFYAYGQSSDGVFTVARSTVAPQGFVNSALITVTTADSSIGASQYYGFLQKIEGFNTADLGWGTANASTVTLSFWVRSSVTGTFGGALRNASVNRSYPFSYVISAANTWEQKSITIAGDTTGTWATDNGTGIIIGWSFGDGSSRLSTAGAWAAGNFGGATGQTNLIATNGATFYITGVQLEKGSTATSFDYRPYGTELVLCQRYYEKTFPVETAPANNAGSSCEVFLSGPQNGGGFSPNMYYYYPWKVTKRASPTVTAFNPRENVDNTWSTFDAGTRANTTPVLENITANALNGYIQRGTLAIASFTASAEL